MIVPSKRERVEDLGVAAEKLKTILNAFEGDWPFFDSKHQYDAFEEKIKKDENLYSFHLYIRHLKEELWDVFNICDGERDS